jgi:polyadenylate-binding protein
MMNPGSLNRSRSNSAKRKNKSDKPYLPSLHIGNLPNNFFDLDLFKFIKQNGFNVINAKVVSDVLTKKSLLYGYAQFNTLDEAKACKKALNNVEIMGKSITISVQSDHKPNPKANIFIRNIAPTVTQKTLFDIYSKFGNIIKCKLDCYNDGTSRCICYVQYEKEKDAKEAISKTHDLELEGKKLEVFPHEKRSNKPEEQKVEKSEKTSNNIFVQGLPKGIEKTDLEKLFGEFGEITSAVVQKNGSDDLLANTGFVCFKDSNSASEAIKKLNKQKQPDNSFLFVSHHISKRDDELTADKSKRPINQNMIRNLNSCIFVRSIP